MIYTITITRSDGLKEAYVLDEDQIRGARFGIAGHHAEKMVHRMLDVPEVTGDFMPLRRSTLQPGEQLLPSNPHEESEFMKRLREMAARAVTGMTPNQLELLEKVKQRQRDAIMYGAIFPQQTLNTFEKGDSNEG